MKSKLNLKYGLNSNTETKCKHEKSKQTNKNLPAGQEYVGKVAKIELN